ncbi:MAG: hypothetical protein M1376_19520 [Planctomycetes bacterium]|nr:hypothetical protein [Planctomycetota bacterium]
MRGKRRADVFCYLAFAICVSLALVPLYLSGRGPIKTGELGDSDCYMHLLRASDLYRTGQWYDPVIGRSNPPYGDRLHWTRPFDILLLVGAVPGSLVTSFDAALFWWGVVVSPILLVASFLAIRWAVHPLLGDDGSSIIGFLFAVQSAVMSIFQAGRPDHHSLLVFLFLLMVGFALRLIERPSAATICYAAGALSALSMWVSVESLVAVGMTLGLLGIMWVLRGSDFSGTAFHYSASLFTLTGAALAIERPWRDLPTVELDRLSIAYVGIFGILAALWFAIGVLTAHTRLLQRRNVRLLTALTAVAVPVVATWLFFPSLFRGPLGDVSPEMAEKCLAYIQEMRPLLNSDVRLKWGIPLLGYGLAYALFFLIDGEHRRDPRWVSLWAATVLFAALSLVQVRWIYYGQILVLPPAAALIVRMRSRITGHPLAKLLANCGITSMFLALAGSGFMIEYVTKPDRKVDTHPAPPVKTICEYFGTHERWQGRSFRILTHPNFGAEILYRTQEEVIATLYHRNWQGILDTYTTLTAETDEQARKHIRDRAVDLILLSPQADDSTFFLKPDSVSTFYQRLCEGKVPSWCQEVHLPPDLASFRLFEIREP